MPREATTADELDHGGTAEQLSLVATGHDPSPVATTKAPSHLPAYAPCPQCGGLVLTGATPAGELVALDTQVQSYVPLWLADTVRPTLHASRGYPVHRHGGEI